jgi:hypothetical protein
MQREITKGWKGLVGATLNNDYIALENPKYMDL